MTENHWRERHLGQLEGVKIISTYSDFNWKSPIREATKIHLASLIHVSIGQFRNKLFRILFHEIYAQVTDEVYVYL